LRVVVTGHAIGGLAMLAGLSSQSRSPSGASEVMRKHVFADTQLIHPALIRAAVDLLGADHVLAGSDWPIVDDGPIGGMLVTAMRQAGLSVDEQKAIAAGNCRLLLGLG
jgi:aminocarboxymuconate-semialdehyde decarboxylase